MCKDRPGSFGSVPRPIPLEAIERYRRYFGLTADSQGFYDMIDAIDSHYIAGHAERAKAKERQKPPPAPKPVRGRAGGLR